MQELTKYDFFHYLLFVDENGVFRGLAPARNAFDMLRENKVDLAKIVEDGNLKALDGMVEVSVPANSTKHEALGIMDRENLMDLPVVDDGGKFIGIVQRNKLTSSVLLELLARP